MATGYEVKMYLDIGQARHALQSIAKSTDRIAIALEAMADKPDLTQLEEIGAGVLPLPGASIEDVPMLAELTAALDPEANV